MEQTPIKLDTWEALVKATPPAPPILVQGRLMCVEDNSQWPAVPCPWTDAKERDRARQKVHQEAFQWAETQVIRDREQANMLHLVGMTAIAIAACAAVITFGIVATRVF